MAVTPDNSTLIVAEPYGKKLTAFDIGANGGLSNRRVWADLGDGVPDGICLDFRERRLVRGRPQQAVRARSRGRRDLTDDQSRSRLLRLHARGHRQENAASGGDRVAWRRRDDRRAADGSGADRQGARARRGLAIGSFHPGPLLGISGIHSWQPICLPGTFGCGMKPPNRMSTSAPSAGSLAADASFNHRLQSRASVIRIGQIAVPGQASGTIGPEIAAHRQRNKRTLGREPRPTLLCED